MSPLTAAIYMRCLLTVRGSTTTTPETTTDSPESSSVISSNRSTTRAVVPNTTGITDSSAVTSGSGGTYLLPGVMVAVHVHSSCSSSNEYDSPLAALS